MEGVTGYGLNGLPVRPLPWTGRRREVTVRGYWRNRPAPSYTAFLYGLGRREGVGREVEGSVCKRRCKGRTTWVSPTTRKEFPKCQVQDDKRAMSVDPFLFTFSQSCLNFMLVGSLRLNSQARPGLALSKVHARCIWSRTPSSAKAHDHQPPPRSLSWPAQCGSSMASPPSPSPPAQPTLHRTLLR